MATHGGWLRFRGSPIDVILGPSPWPQEAPETPLNDPQTLQIILEPSDSRRLARLCGQFDQHLHLIEERLGVSIRNRGNHFVVEGPEQARIAARAVIIHLYDETARHLELTPDQVHLRLQQSGVEDLTAAEAAGEGEVAPLGVVRLRRAVIKPRGRSQQHYVRAIQQHDINFGIGPAGTGKTYLAVACAVAALESDQVRRILLVRPAVEAGEKLGFLSDLSLKVVSSNFFID